MRRAIGAIGAALLLGWAGSAAPEKTAAPSFHRDILPILSENCFLCHGPDRGTRQAGLRLDRRDDAIKAGVIVPGKPEKSKLIARVFGSGATAMPPASTHKILTAAQKTLLKRWIAAGAPYQRHWAFEPLPAVVPVPKAPPSLAEGGRGGATLAEGGRGGVGPIDAFVRARLAKAGIKPSPEASRADWLRRVTLDLNGVPPTLAEADAFLADRGPGAYERVVDRLLASPRYGERMAAPWLDVARYADSYGYQSDQLCTTWPWRDWVVGAFNRDLPYDKFVTEQIAGDLLPGATRDQRLATAFNRLHRQTNEGGSVAEEWRLEYVADRVRTFGTAFLGLTLECARCHDHKYDPVTQRDFYALSAFFDNIDEYGLYNQSDILPTPSVLLPTPEQEVALGAAQKALTTREGSMAALRQSREPVFRNWLTRLHEANVPDLVGRFDFDGDAPYKNRAPLSVRDAARSDEVALVPGKVGNAARLDGDNNVNIPELANFTRHTPFTIAFWMKDARTHAEPMVVFHASSGTDVGFHGYDLRIEEGVLTARLFRHWPGNAIGVRAKAAILKDVWTHVALTYDGSSRAAGLKLFVDGKPAAVEILRDHLWKGTGRHTLAFGQRFRDRGFQGGLVDDIALFTRALTPIEVAQWVDGKSLAAALNEPARAIDALRDYYFSAIDPEARAEAGRLATAREAIWRAEDPQLEVSAMEEMAPPRQTYLLDRGRYDAPRTDAARVTRATPSGVLPMPATYRRDRLGLAQWLTRPDHPLTARVAVNRLWLQLFDRGLVETVEDFGVQGRQPSHPDLLDWLARDFVAHGWSVKRLVRQIVLSQTYRQASALRPDLRERDPRNVLLARGPSGRLPAETIRDVALFAAGLLDERRGGPPVSPYQPGDLWRETNSMSPGYRQSVGGDLYRRSLYSVVKRTAPLPNMSAFDAVSREVCIARRPATNTPLQAYVLLNDPQFVEAARTLAERTLKEGGATDAEKVRFTFRQLATRNPSATEAKALESLLAGQRASFAKDPDSARKLIAVGERKADASLPPVDLAAATVLAQAVLNLDATLYKR